MKGNKFKKTVSSLAAAALAAQIGFVIPVSAADIAVETIDADFSVTVSQNGNSVTVNVVNNSAEQETVTAYAATYSEDVLSSIELDAANIDASESGSVELTYEEPKEGETVKLFVWDSNNAPVIKSVVLAEGAASSTDTPTDTPTEEPAATIYYSQDYEDVTAIEDVWKAGSFAEGLKLEENKTKYVHFDNNGQAGGRTANTNFTVDLSDKKKYVVEFDLAITAPYGYSGSSQFAIRTVPAPKDNNYITVNDAMFYIEFENGSATAKINGVNTATYTFPSNEWCQ